MPAYHKLQTSSEHFKDPAKQVQSSYATAQSVGDWESSTLVSRVARESPGNANDPASYAYRTVMLGKHGRPLSQTSQGATGSSDTTRPMRCPVCRVTLYSGTTVSMPGRNPQRSQDLRRLNLR